MMLRELHHDIQGPQIDDSAIQLVAVRREVLIHGRCQDTVNLTVNEITAKRCG